MQLQFVGLAFPQKKFCNWKYKIPGIDADVRDRVI